MTKIFIETLEQVSENKWKIKKSKDMGIYVKSKLQEYKNEKDSTIKKSKEIVRIHKCMHDNNIITACEII